MNARRQIPPSAVVVAGVMAASTAIVVIRFAGEISSADASGLGSPLIPMTLLIGIFSAGISISVLVIVVRGMAVAPFFATFVCAWDASTVFSYADYLSYVSCAFAAIGIVGAWLPPSRAFFGLTPTNRQPGE